jgi:hypothetical protein
MSTLTEFYLDTSQHGFSKDYQICIGGLNLGDNFSGQKDAWFNSYFKSVAIPGSKTYTTFLEVGGGRVPFSNNIQTTAVDPILTLTFFCDESQEIYRLFKASTKSNPGDILVLNLLDGAGAYIKSYEFNFDNGFSCIGVSEIKYDKSGTGKILEFNVQFKFVSFDEYVDEDFLGHGIADSISRGPLPNNIKFSKGAKQDNNPLKDILKTINTVTQGLKGVQTAGTAIKSLGRAVRGR